MRNVDYTFRPLTDADALIVWHMLMHAAHESTLESVKSQPDLVRYAADWGRAGDVGWMVVVSGQPVGAAWLRVWSGTDTGFGYIDAATPELAMAMVPQYQGKGFGTQLLAHVLAAVNIRYTAVSLNVRADNPVVRLYERAGFVKVEGSEIVNRTGGVSFTMIHRLER